MMTIEYFTSESAPELGRYCFNFDFNQATESSILTTRSLYNKRTTKMATNNTHFETLHQFTTDYAPTKITQYKSNRTGMSVVTVDRLGPKLQGYFTLATEIFDDSGAPHTLEHLIFMGSKSYPYKGVLDKLANRAYSNTNAWTATDHTAYTLDTAGWDGFKQILPVYLEHVVVPTLTDEGCTTEVWHVNGEGEDAGVVYSEMQGVQNNGPELMDLAARRLLYPEGNGFRYETGGMMEQLRVLTPERIRDFHKEMYQPKNLCLVIVGEINHDELLTILDKFEDNIIDDVPKISDPFRRPWIESTETPDIAETIVKIVEFPEEDESSGDILVAFLGPNCNDIVQTAALQVLLTYLSGSSISVLENIMVEKEELASSISAWWDAKPKSVIFLQPTSVATEKLEMVEKRLFEVLKEVAEKPLDLDYMRECVRRERRQVKFQAESNPELFSNNIISDFLFGDRGGKGEEPTLLDLKTIREYDVIEKWTDEEWRVFLKKWISDAKHISILGKPSKALSEKNKKEETERVAAQKERLGEKGLAELKKKLEDATAKNDAPIPAEVLEQWPVPATSSIHFIKTDTARSGLARALGTTDNVAQKAIDACGNEEAGLFIQFEHVPTNFVMVSILLGTSLIPTELKPLLPLFIDNFFNTPVLIDGKLIPFETIVAQLEKDTISYTISGGASKGDDEGVLIQFQIEPEKYVDTVKAVKMLMLDSVFDAVRLNAALSKILADIPEAKRSGNDMLYAVDAMLHLDSRSVVKARNTLVKGPYLKGVKKLLATEPEAVISKLETLRTSLFKASNMRVLVVADIPHLPSATTAWHHLTSALEPTHSVLPIEKQVERLSPDGKEPGNIGVTIIPMPPIDSSFLLSITKGPLSYTDAIIPAALVAIAYIEAVEGPLWRAVRGTGLAYGTGFGRDVERGGLVFKVYRSPDAFKAFRKSAETVRELADGRVELERSALEGARSSIVVGVADEQPTMLNAAQMSFVNSVVRGVPSTYYSELLEKVAVIGEEEVRAAMRDLLMSCFEVGKANLIVTAATTMEADLKKGFEEAGWAVHVKALNEFKDDYGLPPVKGETPEESEDEEGEGEGSEGSGSGSDEE